MTSALLWTLIFVDPLIILSTIVCATISVIASFFEKHGTIQTAMARLWARSLLKIAGVQVKVEGLEKIRPGRPYVFVSNHLSYMDTPVVLANIPVNFRFMAKSGLFQIPFLGTHLERAGHIPVVLDDPRKSIRALTLGAEVIRKLGISVLIFPEGGRSITGILQPFKEGAAYVAIKAGVEIVPLALVGTRNVLAMGEATFHRARVTVCIADPMPTEGLSLRDRHEMTDKAREQIVRMLATGS